MVAVAFLSAAGCEKITSLLGGRGADKDAATATAAPTAGPPGLAVPQRPHVLPTDTLATVNGSPISRHDLQLRIRELKALQEGYGQTWTSLTNEQLEALLDELINNELMSQDAVARGLDRSTETQRRWSALHRGFFVQEWLRWSQEREDATAEEVERFYEQYKQGFREPEWRKLRQIVVAAEEQAKLALSQLLSGAAEFSTLAKQISVGPHAADGGLLPNRVMREQDRAFLYASEAEASADGVTSLSPALEAAAFAVDQVNGLSSYVKGPDSRYHLFQLIERHEERQRPLTEVWDQIKNALLVQKLQQAVDALEAKAKIERFTERLELVEQ